jgi:ABC-type multidrug transport system fused ATPase/permease subunit
MSLHTKNAVIKTINFAMVFGTPPMTACVIFAAYEMMVGRLSATLAFTTLSLFNILRFPLVVLPKAMRALSEAMASIQRVEAFLLEVVPTDAAGKTKATRSGVKIVSTRSTQHARLELACIAATCMPVPAAASAAAMRLLLCCCLDSADCCTCLLPACARACLQRNAQFKHHGSENFTLNVPEFSAAPGELVAVVGRVGAGKSSLIHAILGNMQQVSGTAETGGRISYVPQNPWCQNLTLRDNILFGLPYEDEKYARVRAWLAGRVAGQLSSTPCTALCAPAAVGSSCAFTLPAAHFCPDV